MRIKLDKRAYPKVVRQRIHLIITAYEQRAFDWSKEKGLHAVLLEDRVKGGIAEAVGWGDFEQLVQFFRRQSDWETGLRAVLGYSQEPQNLTEEEKQRLVALCITRVIRRLSFFQTSEEARREELVKRIKELRDYVERLEFGTDPPSRWRRVIRLLYWGSLIENR